VCVLVPSNAMNTKIITSPILLRNSYLLNKSLMQIWIKFVDLRFDNWMNCDVNVGIS